jgi:hypothetical protein
MLKKCAKEDVATLKKTVDERATCSTAVLMKHRTNRRRTNEYCTRKHDHTKHSMTTLNTSKSINLEHDEHDHCKYQRGTNEYCTREHNHTKHSMTTANTLKSTTLTVMSMII